MRTGRLRERVSIQRKQAAQNTYGEEQPAWVEVAEVWAGVEPLRGDEFLENRRQGAEVDVRIVIRYREGISPEMRVVHGTDTYDVRSAIHVESRYREMQLMCRKIET